MGADDSDDDYAHVPISVSRGHFALCYEVPKFLPGGGAFMYGYAYHSCCGRGARRAEIFLEALTSSNNFGGTPPYAL